MIQVLYASGILETPLKLSFKEIQDLVGGYVERVVLSQTDAQGNITFHRGKEVMVDACCNEEGLLRSLPFNAQVQRRFGSQLNSAFNYKAFSPWKNPGPVGNWVILSGKDKLR